MSHIARDRCVSLWERAGNLAPLRVLLRFAAINGKNRMVILASQAFTAVVPLLLVIASLARGDRRRRCRRRGAGASAAAHPQRMSQRPQSRVRIVSMARLLLVVATLVVVNVVDDRVARASLLLGPVAAAWLLLVARRSGLSWQDLGLGPGTWRRGGAWAGVLIAAVAVVYAAGAALPATRHAFRDSRYQFGLGQALPTAFVLIPVGTVLFEEVAFRGVLWGMVRKSHGVPAATAVSAVLFGIWHVLPSLDLAGHNQAVGDTVGKGTSGQVLSVLGTVLFTGLAGAVFCELRRRSVSLLASAGLHWATNGLGVLTAAAVWAWVPR